MDDISEMILDSEQVVEGVSKNFVKVRILKIFEILNSLKSCSFVGSQYFFCVQYPGEENSTWLLRLSHLHCQNQGITKIADLTMCCNITVQLMD